MPGGLALFKSLTPDSSLWRVLRDYRNERWRDKISSLLSKHQCAEFSLVVTVCKFNQLPFPKSVRSKARNDVRGQAVLRNTPVVSRSQREEIIFFLFSLEVSSPKDREKKTRNSNDNYMGFSSWFLRLLRARQRYRYQHRHLLHHRSYGTPSKGLLDRKTFKIMHHGQSRFTETPNLCRS